jgi:predicted nucleotidyltransferase
MSDVRRERLKAYIERTHFARGDRESAKKEALKVAEFLKEKYRVEVFGIGSLFEGLRRFRPDSDIDLVVKGLPKGRYFEALGSITYLTSRSVDLIPWEDANGLVRQRVRETGAAL